MCRLSGRQQMNLASVARELAQELRKLSAGCNTKSEDHATFQWEASIVEERVNALIEGRPLRVNLRESVLLSSDNIICRDPTLVERLLAFYDACEKSSPGDGPRELWTVRRIDDNGNVFVVREGLTKEEADRTVAEFTARGHKQTYWAEREAV